MKPGYWEQATRARISRRRALTGAATIGGGVAALSLVGCGGGGSDEPKANVSGLVSTPVDTTSKAKSGGTYKTFASADATSFDPIGDATSTVYGQISAYAYPRLIKFATGKYPKAPSGETEGDGAESYEVSADKLQVTFKLRQGIKWDARAPTSGRLMDAEDVATTWARFAKLSPNRADVLYDATVSPFGPVESVSTPDNKTVVFKLKQPDASILPLLAYNRNFYIMPKEAEGGFDARKDIRGAGPWLLSQSTPSAGRTWKKNPEYYNKGRPYIDSIEVPIVPEYSAQLAQFKAGNIWTSVARQEDIVQTKKDVPDATLRLDDAFSAISSVILFGYDGDSPFKDERVRQAVSRAIDRELLTDVMNNRDKFKLDGLDLQTRYHNIISATWEGYWIDARDSKKFGPNGVFYEYSIAEAKKLLSAAGFANGFDTSLFYNGGTQYGTTYSRSADLLAGMLPEIGIRAKQTPKDYSTEYLPNYHYAYTPAQHRNEPMPGYNGILLKAAGSRPTVDLTIFHLQHSKGTQTDGYSYNGGDARKGDPEVDKAIEQFRAEFDHQKQIDQIQEYQRMMAKKALRIPMPPVGAVNFILHWPTIQNGGVYRTTIGGAAIAEGDLNLWIDESRPPVNKKA